MGIICIGAKNKSPLIKYEEKQVKNKKPQISLVRKSWRKRMKYVNNLKKEGYLGLTHTWGQKPLKIWGGKKKSWIGSIEKEKEEKGRKKRRLFEKVKNTWVGKVFYFSFLSNLDQSSTDQVPIEPNKKFSLKLLNFDWSKIGFDQLKNRFD